MQIAPDTFSQGQVNPIVPCRSENLNKLCIDLHNVMLMFRNIELIGGNRLQGYRVHRPCYRHRGDKKVKLSCFGLRIDLVYKAVGKVEIFAERL